MHIQDGDLIVNSIHKVANIMNGYFINIASTIREPVGVSPSDMEKIMQILNTKSATGYDKLPAKIITLAATVIATPLANIVNNSIQQCKFPTTCKATEVVPIHIKNDQHLR